MSNKCGGPWPLYKAQLQVLGVRAQQTCDVTEMRSIDRSAGRRVTGIKTSVPSVCKTHSKPIYVSCRVVCCAKSPSKFKHCKLSNLVPLQRNQNEGWPPLFSKRAPAAAAHFLPQTHPMQTERAVTGGAGPAREAASRGQWERRSPECPCLSAESW